MLFVTLQGRGVGKELFRRAAARCKEVHPELAEITVNSAPGAVDAYGRLGFKETGPEQVENGIRFVPMVFGLDPNA